MRRRLATSTACWAITTAIVLIGAAFGQLVTPSNTSVGYIDSLARIDGANYKEVAEEGYRYQDQTASNVAFFPAYPLTTWWLARFTGLRTVLAQLLISNACGLAAFMLMGVYLQRRSGPSPYPLTAESRAQWDASPQRFESMAAYSLLVLGLFPTTFFFRVAYSESMFLCLAILALYAICRGWPLFLIALVVGSATAVRPVGVALLLPMAWHIWKRSGATSARLRRLAWAVPLGCWGLLAFMTFQYRKFHQPLAFALTQEYHRVRPLATAADKWLALLSWEPLREAYDRLSPGYWQALHYRANPLFSLEFANPIYFVGTAALIILGAWKRWLTSYEILLAAPLLLIPYFTRAYEMRMLSQGRFAAVVFPVYVVLGHLLSKLPLAVAGALLAVSGLMMGLYAALFAAGYPFL